LRVRLWVHAHIHFLIYFSHKIVFIIENNLKKNG
jgi:hypothetical protein